MKHGKLSPKSRIPMNNLLTLLDRDNQMVISHLSHNLCESLRLTPVLIPELCTLPLPGPFNPNSPPQRAAGCPCQLGSW